MICELFSSLNLGSLVMNFFSSPLNFLLVNFDPVTDGQKLTPNSPPCISTGGLKILQSQSSVNWSFQCPSAWVRESGGICPFFMLISGCKWVNNDKI